MTKRTKKTQISNSKATYGGRGKRCVVLPLEFLKHIPGRVKMLLFLETRSVAFLLIELTQLQDPGGH
jgi:hypothetical protein